MVISQVPWPLSFPAGRHGPVPYCVDVRASLVELCASFDVSVLHRVRCVLLHSPKAHSRAGHPCVDDKTELVRPAWPHASMTCARMATPKSGQRSFSVDAARLALAMAEMLTPAYGAPSLELLDESRETAVGVRAGATGESTAHTKNSMRRQPMRSTAFAESTCAWQHIRTCPHSRTLWLDLRAVRVRVPRKALRQHRGRRRRLVGH
jgi:hypothetical protein